jgi:hypothetical protein
MSRIGKTALGLLVTVAGVTVPAAAAEAAGPACEVKYAASAHTGGFTASIEIRNTGTVAIRGWTFGFPLTSAATVLEFYNAVLVTPRGDVTAHDVGWNATVNPLNSINISLLAEGPAKPEPTYFTVNGLRCSKVL